MVLASIIPIHLLATERAEVERARKDGKDLAVAKSEARARAMDKWQAEWDKSDTGSWTRKLCVEEEEIGTTELSCHLVYDGTWMFQQVPSEV